MPKKEAEVGSVTRWMCSGIHAERRNPEKLNGRGAKDLFTLNEVVLDHRTEPAA